MASPLLNAISIGQSYAGRTLFKDINFSVYESERIGLVGPNGAGKSTLMKIMAGISAPENGNIVARKGLTIGYLPQDPHFETDQNLLEALLGPEPEQNENLADAYEWLSRLDLIQFGEYSMANSLSGGWQKRLALAREMLKNPDLILLDEPTNHLDVGSILWLEEYLANQRAALLMITHDRLFLMRVCKVILDLDPRNPNLLHRFDQDYLSYLEEKAALIKSQTAKEQRMRNTLTREKEWLARGAQARQTKQKARIERAGELKGDVKFLEEKNRKRIAELDFGGSGRVPKKLIELKNVDIGYPGKVILKNFNFVLRGKSRLGLLGNNGVGKSSLIKIFSGTLAPLTGTVEKAEQLRVAYFEQNKETLNPALSVLRNICSDGDYVHVQGEATFAKSYLERFLFRYDQMDLPVAKLSGGEKSRLRLAQLMLMEANLLILDEPTNDLDMETLEVLQQAIEDFQGAVVIVTHDRYFLDQVTTEILAFDRTSEDEGAPILTQTFQSYFQWEQFHFSGQKFASKSAAANEAAAALGTEPRSHVEGASSIDSSTVETNKAKKLTFKEQHELKNMEGLIAGLELEKNQLLEKVAKPENLADSSLLTESYTRLSRIDEELEKHFARWQDLEARKDLR